MTRERKHVSVIGATLIGFCRTIVSSLRRWKISVGCDPKRVAAPALILFPLLPATLCCGLAGILVLRRKDLPDAPGADLPLLFGRASGNDLAALLDGRIAAADYLGGESSLEAMERELLRLKGEDAFREIFFDPRGEAQRLTRLSDADARISLGRGGASGGAGRPDFHRRPGGRQPRPGPDPGSRLGAGARYPGQHRADRPSGRGRGVADVAPEALPKYRKMNLC